MWPSDHALPVAPVDGWVALITWSNARQDQAKCRPNLAQDFTWVASGLHHLTEGELEVLLDVIDRITLTDLRLCFGQSLIVVWPAIGLS